MKLGFITSSFYPAVVYGGPTYSTYALCGELAKQGVEVWVATTNSNGTEWLSEKTNVYHKFDERFQVKYYHDTVLRRFSLEMIFKSWKDVKDADVVHTQDIFHNSGVFSMIYGAILNKPVFLSPRGSLGPWCLSQGNAFKKWWINGLIKPFSKRTIFHATSEQEKTEILAVFPDARVVICPNGIDLSLFRQAESYDLNTLLAKQQGRAFQFKKFIVSLSRLHLKKGYDILIRSLPEILKVYPDTAVLLAGHDEGGEKARLEELIKELDLGHCVFFVGHLDGKDKADFLASGDVFVLPSHNENFGNVYLEALASGTPIVASIHTPWSEVIEQQCGQWVDNTPSEVAKATINVMQQDREVLRTNAKRYAGTFEWSSVAAKMKQYYQDALDGKI